MRMTLGALLFSIAAVLPVSAIEPADTVDLSDRVVVLVFDDGWHCVYTDAYPLLKKYGMKSVQALISGSIGRGSPQKTGNPYGYMNKEEIQEIIDSTGAEIASHSKKHPFLTRLTNDEIRAELNRSKQELEAMFGQEVIAFVYPYGDYDKRVRDIVASSGYSLARSIRPGVIDLDGKPYDLPATEVRRTTTLGFIQSQIVKCELLILFFHRIVPSPAYYTDWSTANFARLLDWLDKKQVQVLTLNELYESYKGRLPETVLIRRTWRNRIEWNLLQDIDFDITRTVQGR